ncbi:MAG: hypothetical protein ACRD8A_02675 [Candidatus Acidiferrales bacterium]
MLHRKPIRFTLIAFAILAVLFATTLGMVWHTHVHTSDANCVFCHLNHQPITNALSFTPALPKFGVVRAQRQSQESVVAQTSVFFRVPARAPPAL